ncbi:metal-dependent hydrolase [Peptostreptococcaceae bacterium AGR-M142]
MKIKYLGHSAFLINTKETNILIDPFIKDNPLCSLSLKELPKIDYILVTHGHSDHLGDTITIAREHMANVICNFEISLYLQKYNIKCHPMHIGGRFDFPFGNVKMTIAIHGSGIIDGNHVVYGGNPCGFILNIEGKKIYHAGDTGLTLEMKLLERENLDIAMLPIGGNFTMDLDDCVLACDFIKPKTIVPMHYDTFDLIKSNPTDLSKKLKEVNLDSIKIDILKPEEEKNY